MIRTTVVLFILLLLTGCSTSMTPSQFAESFPQSTTTKFYEKPAATSAVSEGECNVIVENRKYVAPIGLTVHGDVKNGAIGVDEWVKTDRGNSYTINNYEWISVPAPDGYATQLVVYFDTLMCD